MIKLKLVDISLYYRIDRLETLFCLIPLLIQIESPVHTKTWNLSTQYDFPLFFFED